ncbi:hypothetical protein G7Y89_g6054 [Cudoniella acicularis]|uniref:Uncharacterized protein n=1 Tax=Cudoniella acicularis TaxID=354080 RepID=A0A8H4W546_9HELO|nr:hypothetical protein G7Y89_g6054 [Cudoniella acicularis]
MFLGITEQQSTKGSNAVISRHKSNDLDASEVVSPAVGDCQHPGKLQHSSIRESKMDGGDPITRLRASRCTAIAITNRLATPPWTLTAFKTLFCGLHTVGSDESRDKQLHMARHKEKDDEAGGEGLGGRPSYTQEGAKRRQIGRPERKLSKASEEDKKLSNGESVMNPFPTPTEPMSRTDSAASSTIVVDTGASALAKVEELHQDSWVDMNALPSPVSESESSFQSADQSPSAELSEFETLYEDTWPAIHDDRLTDVNSPILERPSEYPNPSWSPQPFQTFMGAMAELPYDDIFKPETGLRVNFGSSLIDGWVGGGDNEVEVEDGPVEVEGRVPVYVVSLSLGRLGIWGLPSWRDLEFGA